MSLLGRWWLRWALAQACVLAWAMPSTQASLGQAVQQVAWDPKGGEAALDSLLAGVMAPDMRLEALIAKGRAQMALGELDGAARTANLAIQVAGQAKHAGRRVEAEYLQYAVAASRGDYNPVLEPSTRLFERAKRLGLKSQMADLADLLGRIYNSKGQVAPAIEHHKEALRLAEELGDQRIRLRALKNLANLYLTSRYVDKSMECIAQGVSLARKAGDTEMLVALLNIKANCLDSKKLYQEELQVLVEVQEMARRTGLKPALAMALGNKADLCLSLKRYGQALANAEQALATSKSQDLVQALELQVTRAQALGHLGRSDEAVEIMRAVLRECKTKGLLLDEAQTWEALTDTLANAGRYREALAAHRSFKKISDEVLHKENQNAVAGFREQFEAEKRDREIAALIVENALMVGRKRAERALFTLGALSLAVIAGLLFWRHRAEARNNRRLRELNARLEGLSLTDALTGLRNRRYFLTRIEEESAHALRLAHSGDPHRLGMLMMDLDHFKKLNDTEGHAAGDALLKTLAKRLQDALRKEDVVVRWGGEEFLMLSRDVTPGGLREVAQRVVDVVHSEPFPLLHGHATTVTCSIGYCCFPLDDWMDWGQAFRIADAAMYLAKIQGRDRAIGVRAGEAWLGPEGLQMVLDDLVGAMEKGLICLEEASTEKSVCNSGQG